MIHIRDKFRTKSAKKDRGFTLVELMVTLSILAILMAIGAPQMRAFLQKRQVAADFDNLASAIQLAKSEALKRSGNVSICPLASDVGNPACAASATTDWSKGWMVFIDASDPAGATTPYDATRDTAIKVEQGSRTGSVLHNVALQAMRFGGNGLLINSAAGRFTIRAAGTTANNLCRQLTVSMQGRASANNCA